MRQQSIFVNFKRFDVPASMGGVNRTDRIASWAGTIVGSTLPALEKYSRDDVRFAMYFPEAHIMNAVEAIGISRRLEIGCQGVCPGDVAPGGNFGAFTTLRPAAAAAALGCTTAIIGHCEERNDKRSLLSKAGCNGFSAINRVLNEEIAAATKRGLSVLYCIGERDDETDRWESVLSDQLLTGLDGIDKSMVTIGYEPVWSIGPGKTPAGKEHITKIARFIKETIGDVPVVYGGGLKEDNAEMLASIDEIDGGLIALTRFSGEIGFYPEEYLRIVELYMDRKRGTGHEA